MARRRPRTPDDAPLSDEDHRRKLSQLQNLLHTELRALYTGENWARLLRTAAQLPGQSFTNVMLIAAQRPDATMVAGYQAWQATGRQVTKGEAGIRVIVERGGRNGAPASARRGGTGGTRRAAVQDRPRSQPAGQRVGYLWDVAQTSGPPIAVRAAAPLAQGQVPPGLWEALTWLARREGFGVEREYCGQGDSVTRWRARRIRIRPDLNDARAAQALAHELGHVLLDGSVAHPLGASTAGCRGIEKMAADSASFAVSVRLGVDTTGYTFPYVASWAGRDPRAQPEAAILATGERIVTAATQITTYVDTVLPPRLIWHKATTPNPDTAPARRTDPVRQESAAIARSDTTGVPGGPPSPAAATGPVAAILSEAHRFFAGHLDRSWVPGYLRDRGLNDTVATHWQIGYASAAWTALTDHLRSLGHDAAAIEAAGLARRSSRGTLIDHFRDRAMLAIRDPHGTVVGFIGRAHPSADPTVPKYLNSPETVAYKKGNVLFLYEASSFLGAGAVPVIVEGPFDAIAVSIAGGGHYAGVAPCGTALTSRQVAVLADVADLRENSVLVALDGDRAGRDGAVKAYDILRVVTAKMVAVVLPAGRDPAEILQTDGPSALAEALRHGAQPLANRVVDARLDTWGRRLEDPAGQLYAMRDAAALIADMLPRETAAGILQVTGGQKLETLGDDMRSLAVPELTEIADMMPADVSCQVIRVADQLGFEAYSDVLAEVVNALAKNVTAPKHLTVRAIDDLDHEHLIPTDASPAQLAINAFPGKPCPATRMSAESFRAEADRSPTAATQGQSPTVRR